MNKVIKKSLNNAKPKEPPLVHRYVVSCTKRRGEVLMRKYAKGISGNYQVKIDKKNMRIINLNRFIDYHFISMYQLLRYGDGLSVDEWTMDWTCSRFKEEDLHRVIKVLTSSFDYKDYQKRIKEIIKQAD